MSDKEFKFDPDSDGFELPYDTALKLHINCNLLYFIRKTLDFNQKAKEPKAFLALASSLKNLEPFDVESWNLKTHDRALLKLISRHGMFLEDKDKTEKLFN